MGFTRSKRVPVGLVVIDRENGQGTTEKPAKDVRTGLRSFGDGCGYNREQFVRSITWGCYAEVVARLGFCATSCVRV